ncbi:MAG TPA: PAS domain S-box protein, partial [Nitrospiraceae bacterium]|nr:PAS domain S-box protein [Nitrospiraceae bacterium]
MAEIVAPRVGPPGPGDTELLQKVVESAADYAIIAMDPSGKVTYWNAGAERVLGYSEAEMLGSTGDILFTPEDQARGEPQAERAQANSGGSAEDERWHMRKNGERFWGSGALMTLSGMEAGFVKIMRDLTERREAQERLRASEQLFRMLATNIPQLVFCTRGSGLRTWGSPQWVVYSGLSF